MGKDGGVWGKYVGTVGAVDRMVNALLGAWGSLVAKSPVLTIVVSAICALALSGGLGLIGKNIESDGDKLWCVHTSPCLRVRDASTRNSHQITRIVGV